MGNIEHVALAEHFFTAVIGSRQYVSAHFVPIENGRRGAVMARKVSPLRAVLAPYSPIWRVTSLFSSQ